MSEKRIIALLSNITVDLVVGRLREKYNFYIPNGFDTWIQEVIYPASEIYSIRFDAIIVLLDGTEARSWRNADEGKDRITIWKQTVNMLVNLFEGTPIFVSTIDIRENRIISYAERRMKYEWENEWYQFIQAIAEEKSYVYVLDIVELITEIGRKRFYSNKMWYMSSMPYSREGLIAISNEIERALTAVFIVRKKIIVLDLDNTLWGGVIGEDGVDGIELSAHKEGQRYYDFQRQLLEMKNRGIVLAINSKNNLADVETVINRHPSMLLRDGDFVSKKINWNNKAVNIKSIESELNLTEDGFIFIDDNPMERETVKNECPGVLVLDIPIDTTELIRFAENIWYDYCKPLRILSEDKVKTLMYQIEENRKREMAQSLNLDDYIKRLEMMIDMHKVRHNEIERVFQLINKTNQFNLTTKRYTYADLMSIINDPYSNIYVVCNSDKYGDNGLVSVIILKSSHNEMKIDTFLMSCRVMGRKIENVIINEIAGNSNGKKLIGEFIPTAKNTPVKDLYEELGFSLISNNNGHKIYEYDTACYEKKYFDYCKYIGFEK